MGLIKKTFVLAIATIGGIYLTSKEGSDARKKIQEHILSFTPIIKDLLLKIEDVLIKSKDLNSDEIRVNIEERISKIKKILHNTNAGKVGAKVEDIIKTTSKKIRKLRMDIQNSPSNKKTSNQQINKTSKSQKSSFNSRLKLDKIKEKINSIKNN